MCIQWMCHSAWLGSCNKYFNTLEEFQQTVSLIETLKPSRFKHELYVAHFPAANSTTGK